MPPTQTCEGIRAALQIRDRFPSVGILLLSTFTEIDEAVELFTATASRVGYLLKDSVADLGELTSALTRISEGGTVFDSGSSSNCSAAHGEPILSMRSRHENVESWRSWQKVNPTPGSPIPSG